MTPDTPVTILEKLRQLDDSAAWHEAWRRFVHLYTPVLYLWLERTGLHRPAADIVVQDVFIQLVEKIEQYHREKGRFRTWLRAVAMNKYREIRRQNANGAKPLPDEQIADAGQPDPAEEFWEKEFRDHVVRRALAIMKADFSEMNWQGFWEFYIEGHTAAQIAATQGRTVRAVIAANFRILTRLKEEFADMLD